MILQNVEPMQLERRAVVPQKIKKHHVLMVTSFHGVIKRVKRKKFQDNNSTVNHYLDLNYSTTNY